VTAPHLLAYPPEHDTARAQLLDPFSRERIAGLVDLDGIRVLEVGTGGGTMTRYLAGEVGATGFVFTVDRHPRTDLSGLHNIAPIKADVARCELPGHIGLVHARLTLGHIPQRRQVLARLVDTLTPGGVMLIEDWWAVLTDMVMAAPNPRAALLYTRFQETLGSLFEASGTDRDWARHIHGALLGAGLDDVQTVVHATAWSGGSPGARMIQSTIDQAYDRLVIAGLSPQELAAVKAMLDNPALVLRGHLLFSTSGRNPIEQA